MTDVDFIWLNYLITNYQLPITNYQLPITNYQLPIANYQLPITNYQLFLLPITISPVKQPTQYVRA